MSYIFERLYLGDLDDACNSSDLRDKKCISHILTVDCKPLFLEAQTGFMYKFVHALDMEEFDLLSHFDSCIKFIDDGREAGGVLVHCYAGQSRSATIAIAYMMARQDMTLSDALQLVKKMRPSVGPNSGFISQLELFENMGSCVNQSDIRYRQYRLNSLATHMLNFNIQEDHLTSCLSSDPSLSNSAEAIYRCRKCRRPLFRESGIVNHTAANGYTAFKKHSKTKVTLVSKNQTPGEPCSESIFIEPVVWMQSMILQLHGKLSCPNCKGKIGSFIWAGEQCPCGHWVIPAFHLQKSRLDYCNNIHPLRNQTVANLTVAPPPKSSASSVDENKSFVGNKDIKNTDEENKIKCKDLSQSAVTEASDTGMAEQTSEN